MEACLRQAPQSRSRFCSSDDAASSCCHLGSGLQPLPEIVDVGSAAKWKGRPSRPNVVSRPRPQTGRLRESPASNVLEIVSSRWIRRRRTQPMPSSHLAPCRRPSSGACELRPCCLVDGSLWRAGWRGEPSSCGFQYCVLNGRTCEAPQEFVAGRLLGPRGQRNAAARSRRSDWSWQACRPTES